MRRRRDERKKAWLGEFHVQHSKSSAILVSVKEKETWVYIHTFVAPAQKSTPYIGIFWKDLKRRTLHATLGTFSVVNGYMFLLKHRRLILCEVQAIYVASWTTHLILIHFCKEVYEELNADDRDQLTVLPKWTWR